MGNYFLKKKFLHAIRRKIERKCSSWRKWKERLMKTFSSFFVQEILFFRFLWDFWENEKKFLEKIWQKMVQFSKKSENHVLWQWEYSSTFLEDWIEEKKLYFKFLLWQSFFRRKFIFEKVEPNFCFIIFWIVVFSSPFVPHCIVFLCSKIIYSLMFWNPSVLS